MICCLCEAQVKSGESRWARSRPIPEEARQYNLVPEISANNNILCNSCSTHINRQITLVERHGKHMLKPVLHLTKSNKKYVNYVVDLDPTIVPSQQSSSNLTIPLSWTKNQPHSRKNPRIIPLEVPIQTNRFISLCEELACAHCGTTSLELFDTSQLQLRFSVKLKCRKCGKLSQVENIVEDQIQIGNERFSESSVRSVFKSWFSSINYQQYSVSQSATVAEKLYFKILKFINELSSRAFQELLRDKRTHILLNKIIIKALTMDGQWDKTRNSSQFWYNMIAHLHDGTHFILYSAVVKKPTSSDPTGTYMASSKSMEHFAAREAIVSLEQEGFSPKNIECVVMDEDTEARKEFSSRGYKVQGDQGHEMKNRNKQITKLIGHNKPSKYFYHFLWSILKHVNSLKFGDEEKISKLQSFLSIASYHVTHKRCSADLCMCYQLIRTKGPLMSNFCFFFDNKHSVTKVIVPKVVLAHTFSFLPFRDLLNVSEVCKYFNLCASRVKFFN